MQRLFEKVESQVVGIAKIFTDDSESYEEHLRYVSRYQLY